MHDVYSQTIWFEGSAEKFRRCLYSGIEELQTII